MFLEKEKKLDSVSEDLSSFLQGGGVHQEPCPVGGEVIKQSPSKSSEMGGKT